jgi:hypothetical protein
MSREELDLFPCFCSLFLGLDWLLGTFGSSNARFWIAEPIYSWRVSLSDAAWTYFNKGWSRLFIMIRLDALTIDIYQYQYYWSSQYGIVPSVQPFTLYSWQSERFDLIPSPSSRSWIRPVVYVDLDQLAVVLLVWHTWYFLYMIQCTLSLIEPLLLRSFQDVDRDFYGVRKRATFGFECLWLT